MSLGKIVYVDVDKIHANKYNPNVMSGEKFEALVDFCQSHGADQLDPIWLRKNGIDNYEVIDGEHRWKAAKEVGWKRLGAFIIDMAVDDAKAFNVRKNRERGKLDAFKLGKILYDEYQQEGQSQNGIGKKYGLSQNAISEYITAYENKVAILEALGIDASIHRHIGIRKALDVLRELKREERGEVTKDTEESQQLEKFLRRYARALQKNPLPKVQKNDVNIAIEFFKRLLDKRKIRCPVCGEEHLQWRCGHEF